MASENRVRVVLEVNGKEVASGIASPEVAESLAKIAAELLEKEEDSDPLWRNWEKAWAGLDCP